MTKYKEIDYEVRKSWWPFWLLPLLVAILIILIAIFIFIFTLDSKHHCLFGCEQSRDHIAIADQLPRNDDVFPPKTTETLPTTSAKYSDNPKTERNKMEITLTGKVKFDGSSPDSIPPGSHLTVKFEDVSLMDAPSKIIGKAEVDVSNYKKGDDLTYTIKCKKQNLPHGNSVSAVLNMGWEPDGDHWIQKGDYLTDTTHRVKIEDGKDMYYADINLVLNG